MTLPISQSLPQHYRELIQSIWKLQRVHNSDQLDDVMEMLSAFCAKHLSGKSFVHQYKPGDVYNHWIIPPRWNLRSYRLIGPDGKVLFTEKDHPLAVGCYSISIDQKISLEELKPKIITRPDIPQAFIFDFKRMYRHWEKDWSISIPFEQFQSLPAGTYHIQIDAEFNQKPMPVFEYLLEGKSDKTILMAGHIDHPGMINDSVSGCIASLQTLDLVAKSVANLEYSYRALLLPEIIGSAVYMKDHEELVAKSYFALCPNMTAHPAPLAFCRSKHGSSLLDFAMTLALKQSGLEFKSGKFHRYPDCGDEISFDCLGYQIPCSTLSRIGEMFKFYHTSHDNFDNFTQPDWQQRHQQLLSVLVSALTMIERNVSLQTEIRGNPCMSNPALNLYLNPSNVSNVKMSDGLMLDLDGTAVDLRNFMEFFLDCLGTEDVSLLDIAYHGNISFDFVESYAQRCREKGLVNISSCNRKFGLERIAGTSLSLAGLV